MERARAVLLRGIEQGAMPGAVVCVRRRGETLWHEALGTTAGTTPTTLTTLYDLASITKPLASASSICSLVEHGELLLTAPVTHFLPEASTLKDATVHHLLTHTSGLPAWIACYKDEGSGLDAAVRAILKLSLRGAPGTHYEYSCLNYILLAKIIEAVTSTTLDKFATATIFAPLGLTDLTFHPDPARCAPTISQEGPNPQDILSGIVHDGNARAICAEGNSVAGNAGLFGTADAVARFGEAILHGGLFGAPTRQRWLTPQSTPPGHTLAFFCKPNPLTPTGELLSDEAVGHSGFTGTALVIDPESGCVIALLTNAVYLDNSKTEFLPMRRRFFNAVAGAL